MSKSYSAALIAASFAARHPAPATLNSVSASADDNRLEAVQAAARPFSSVNGKLVWIKATEHFYVGGEFIGAGDFVEVPEIDANAIVAASRAILSTAEEAAADGTAKAKK